MVKKSIANTGARTTFTQCYNVITILQHYNFISLYSICDKLCLLGSSISRLKFSKVPNFMKYTKNSSKFCFTYFLYSWEFTLRVILLFTIWVKKHLTVVYYLLYCCFLLYFTFVFAQKKESFLYEIIVIMLSYLLLTNSVFFVE